MRSNQLTRWPCIWRSAQLQAINNSLVKQLAAVGALHDQCEPIWLTNNASPAARPALWARTLRFCWGG